jgi:hypothetical protein
MAAFPSRERSPGPKESTGFPEKSNGKQRYYSLRRPANKRREEAVFTLIIHPSSLSV